MCGCFENVTNYGNKIILWVVNVSLQGYVSFILMDFHEVKTLLFNHLTPPPLCYSIFNRERTWNWCQLRYRGFLRNYFRICRTETKSGVSQFPTPTGQLLTWTHTRTHADTRKVQASSQTKLQVIIFVLFQPICDWLSSSHQFNDCGVLSWFDYNYSQTAGRRSAVWRLQGRCQTLQHLHPS